MIVFFLTLSGNFTYFSDYVDGSNYPLGLTALRWELSVLSVYEFEFSTTACGQYFEDGTHHELNVIRLE